MLKTVLFDFDGTIADTLPLIFHTFREVLWNYTGEKHSDEDIVAMFGPPEKGIIEKQVNSNRREAAFRDFHRIYGEKHSEFVKADPGIVKTLQFLQDRRLRLGIVTGKGRISAEVSLQQLQLASFFEVVITGDDVERPKPHPEGLWHAMHRLGAQPSETAYVGDSDADILAGKRAGVRTVGVNWLAVSQTEAFTEQPDAFFERFSPFREWILQHIST